MVNKQTLSPHIQVLAKVSSSMCLYVNKMNYMVVGDAKTQMDKLEGLGFGKPILLNEVEAKSNIEQ